MPAKLDGLLASPHYVDALYERFRRDPGSVDADVAALFRDLEPRSSAPAGLPAFLTERGGLPAGVSRAEVAPGIQIYDLVHTFRQFGHLAADLDPLGRSPRSHPFLELDQFGFEAANLEEQVSCAGFHGTQRATLREHIALLRETYCGPIGVEYMDVLDAPEREWLQQRMEPVRNRPRLPAELERHLLRELVAADVFEETLGRMYPGAKRFSLEGGTTLITLLQVLVEAAGAGRTIEQMVIGMAHRGRLNVLAHVLKKPLEYILAEFEGRPQAIDVQGYGDVKYHLGYSYDYLHPGGHTVHLSMAYNPSHLEAVNPVVEGIVRAKQNQIGDARGERIVPVLVHGDAAFAGQGVVAETLALANLRGYETGGTVHIIVNNQVGFTADPEETRSTTYASDLAKSVRAPVFHVNADHPEAVYLIGQLALEYRQTFRRDVVVDLICFRRHGHNELDDPSYTQPVTTRLIAGHPSVSNIYAEKLERDQLLTAGEKSSMAEEVRERMRSAREHARSLPTQVVQHMGGAWRGLRRAGVDWSAPTGVPASELATIGDALQRAPQGWKWHPRLRQLIEKRAQMTRGELPLDWGAAESLAFGSLLLEGTPVRLSGQDSCRGTFSHRHAVYADLETGERYVPLNHVREGQARFEVLNSPLSEEAVLGFEYGYASADPWTLVIWEAQFGDFANGAQVVIDQLIASAEYKWGRMSGLTLLLPHGHEGQGPEHSSARLERFLELCGENNMQVVSPTTPAQIFHCLRRQMRREFRKPLVVMSPKSLLRHPDAVSPLADLTGGGFANVIDDHEVDKKAAVRVLLCSGKVYYRLRDARAERGVSNVALVRLEQLYPYPLEEMRRVLAGYPRLERLVWVQEEPRNMGAWRHLLHRFKRSLPRGVRLSYVGRDSRAVPATGSYEVHQREEEELVQAAFTATTRVRLVRRERPAPPLPV